MAYFYTAAVEDAAVRLEYWRDLVSHSILPVEVRPHHGEPPPLGFDGAIEAADLADVQVATVTAGAHQVHRTAESIAARDDEMYCVLLVVNGNVRFSREDQRDVLNPGDMTLLDSSDHYRLAFDGDHKLQCFHIPRRLIPVPREEVARVVATRIVTTDGVGALVRPFLARLAQQAHTTQVSTPDRLAATVLDLTETLLLERLGQLREHAEAPRRLVLPRVRNAIEARLGSPDLTPERLAAEHHISVDRLETLFRAEGVSVSRWIAERRLQRCRRDLSDPALDAVPVPVIGARWGFGEPAGFDSAFQARFGLTPHACRREHRG